MASGSAHSIAAIILAAGKGTRMKSDLHKVLHPIGGKPMVRHLLDTVSELNPANKIVVVGAGREQVEKATTDCDIVTQTEQLGTGHAVAVCQSALKDSNADILVLYGDVPFIPLDVMKDMIKARKASPNTGLVVLGFTPQDAARYGRLITNASGQLERIVEYKDATDEERAIKLCNSGMMLIDGERAFDWLSRLSSDNAAGEYYLTDLVEIARTEGHNVAVVEADETDVMGVNSRAELATAEAAWQNKQRQKHMENGVTMTAPEAVFFSFDTKLGRDVTIEPNVIFGPNVSIGDNATILGFSHIEGTVIKSGASVGPFARLRPGAEIGENAKVGNFVEIKKSTIETGAKVSHLSYIGDAFVGEKANIGAGTITCNYDGFLKYKTTIGAGAFIGSNSALVAPVTIGDGAIVGAGSTISEDVVSDAISATRAPQSSREGAAKRFRERGQAAKAQQKK